MSNFARLIIDLISYLDIEEFKRLLNYGISIKEITLCVNNARVGADERERWINPMLNKLKI